MNEYSYLEWSHVSLHTHLYDITARLACTHTYTHRHTQKQTQTQKDITLYTLYHCEWQLPLSTPQTSSQALQLPFYKSYTHTRIRTSTHNSHIVTLVMHTAQSYQRSARHDRSHHCIHFFLMAQQDTRGQEEDAEKQDVENKRSAHITYLASWLQIFILRCPLDCRRAEMEESDRSKDAWAGHS